MLKELKLKSIRNVHQFCVSSSYGDAVTNGMILTKRLLTSMGVNSEIYVGKLALELKEDLQPLYRLKPKKDDLIIIHHAIGHDHFDWLLKLPGHKVLVYHNITPAEFFPEGSSTRKYIELGFKQLRDFLKAGFNTAIADSDFNAKDLIDLNYKTVKTIPLLVDLEVLKNKPWNKKLQEEESKVPCILFVGRVVQNKCQHQLIETAKALRAMTDKPFQVVMVGGFHEEDPYYQSLVEEIKKHGLEDWVRFTGKIPEDDLYAWYRAADCFVCFSEHEGFGVPLLEAMAFDVPVIAFDATNVPYLVNNAGLVFKDKNCAAIAATVKLMMEDQELRQKILTAQRKRVEEFSKERLQSELKDFLLNFDAELSSQLTT